MKKLTQLIEKTDFCINYTTQNDRVLIQQKTGCYLIEFILFYDKIYTNYIASDYMNPEEFDVNFEPLEISDLIIYYKNEPLELSDEEIENLKTLIEIKIFD